MFIQFLCVVFKTWIYLKQEKRKVKWKVIQ